MSRRSLKGVVRDPPAAEPSSSTTAETAGATAPEAAGNPLQSLLSKPKATTAPGVGAGVGANKGIAKTLVDSHACSPCGPVDVCTLSYKCTFNCATTIILLLPEILVSPRQGCCRWWITVIWSALFSCPTPHPQTANRKPLTANRSAENAEVGTKREAREGETEPKQARLKVRKPRAFFLYGWHSPSSRQGWNKNRRKWRFTCNRVYTENERVISPLDRFFAVTYSPLSRAFFGLLFISNHICLAFP